MLPHPCLHTFTYKVVTYETVAHCFVFTQTDSNGLILQYHSCPFLGGFGISEPLLSHRAPLSRLLHANKRQQLQQHLLVRPAKHGRANCNRHNNHRHGRYWHPAAELVGGVLAGAVNVTSGYPFDTMEVAAASQWGSRSTGITDCFLHIWRTEGGEIMPLASHACWRQPCIPQPLVAVLITAASNPFVH